MMAIRDPGRDKKIRAVRLRGGVLNEWDQNYIIRCLDAMPEREQEIYDKGFEDGRCRERERCLGLARVYRDQLNIIEAIAMGDVVPLVEPEKTT